MTPLLWSLMQNYTMPRDQRSVRWTTDEANAYGHPCDILRPALEGVHSYEVSAISDSCASVVEQGYSPNGLYTFSPGASVWLEYVFRGERLAILVYGNQLYSFSSSKEEGVLAARLDLYFEPQMSGMSAYAESQRPWGEPNKGFNAIGAARYVRSLFSIINRPQHVGLKVHQPHKGRLKKLAGTGFPLRVWHEVTVGAKTRDHGGQQIESGISGTMPYHHVRAHYKPSLGIVIPEHWRGDPSIGIKQTRYRVEKPK